ncbi:hypothetical protein K1T71_011565 [Dendrolimus kikuchii]|uniref:Uncharacterized protein n=1 Tax=Dendrolimus kikuchii TaxID=765133 RepID=A0ACC1CP42_9NEOP|nr:hypothetical protein K1T71_011565 [Dendrolimus kikuchii]
MAQPDSNSFVRDNSEFSSNRLKMNDDVELYRTYSTQLHTDNVHFLKRYKSQIKWKKSGDRSIDLGCGDGRTTSTLEKYLPPNYEVLIGCDLNPNMLKFANATYATDRMKFQVLDMEGDIPADWREGFDHVFSFHALQWARNQERAFRNIFDLLEQGGDCFLVFVARHYVYDIFLNLSMMELWSPYLKNVVDFLSPYHECQEPDKKVSDIMEKVGFRHVDVRCKQMVANFSSPESVKRFVLAVNPFAFPTDLTKEFLDDVEGALRGLCIVSQAEDGQETVKCSYNLLVAYATK